MIKLIAALWPLLLLFWAVSVAGSIAQILFNRGFRRIDVDHADDLPMTAGEWLEHALTRFGLSWRIRKIVTDKSGAYSLDCYHPYHHTIQLSAETYFKRDPAHWAIAAHELGHAMFKPVRVFSAIRQIKRAVTSVAIGLTVGNFIYALPGITELAFKLFVTVAVLHAFVLIGEFAASRWALKTLRAEPGFGRTHMRSARRTLTLAFATYLFSFASYLVLLTQWHVIEAVSRVPHVLPTAVFTTLHWVVAAVASAVLVYYAGFQMWRTVRPGRGWVSRLAGTLALITLVALVWDLRADPRFALCVMLAGMPLASYFLMLVVVPIYIVEAFTIDPLLRRFRVEPTHLTAEFRRDRYAGSEQLKLGNAMLKRLTQEYADTPYLGDWLHTIIRIAFIPLLIALWLA